MGIEVIEKLKKKAMKSGKNIRKYQSQKKKEEEEKKRKKNQKKATPKVKAKPYRGKPLLKKKDKQYV